MKQHLAFVAVSTFLFLCGAASAGPQGIDRRDGGDGNKRGVERPEFLGRVPDRQKNDLERLAEKFEKSPVLPTVKDDGSVGVIVRIPLESPKPESDPQPRPERQPREPIDRR